jgi:hypothetical protein
MKILERVGAALTLIALWITIAFFAGILARPFYEAFRFGFGVWSS